MGNIEKFDFIADQYDTDERIKISKIIADTIRTHVINGKEKVAIDYGCGTGLVGMHLLDVFHSILFMDPSQNMIEQVKHKIGEFHIQTAGTLCCDLTAEYPPNLHVDYIFMVQVLLHIKEVELILSHLHNILNIGGHLLIVDFDKNDAIVSDEVHNGFEQEKLINTIEKLGFTGAESKTFYYGEKMFMNKDASLFILDCVK